jgi:hypothetical protein
MTLSLAWEQATTFRMLAAVSTMHTDEVWKSLTRRRGRASLGSGGANRRRVALDDGILVVCLVVLVGLVVLGSVLILLSWATARLPPSVLQSCPEFDGCVLAAPDGNELLWVDDPLTDAPRMTR